MSILEMLDRVENGIDIDRFTISWSMKGIGWGQYHFYMGNDDKVHIQNECMSRESIKKILCMIVDAVVLDDDDVCPQPPADTVQTDEGC